MTGFNYTKPGFLSPNIFDLLVLQENYPELNFSHEPPLGTVRNGKEKIRMNPPRWRRLDSKNGQLYPTGMIVTFLNSKNTESTGFLQSYDSNWAVVKTHDGIKKIPFTKIRKTFTNLNEYRKEIAKKNLNTQNKVQRILNTYNLLPEDKKKGITIPRKRTDVIEIDKNGEFVYDWPNEPGLNKTSAKSFNPQSGYFYRVGTLAGRSWTNEKNIDHDKISIPYEKNANCEIAATFNNHNYRKKMQALLQKNRGSLNKLLRTKLLRREFREMRRRLKKFEKSIQHSNLSVNPLKGVAGTAAPWNSMPGGGTQLTTPLSGIDMQRLEILYPKETKK